MKILFTAEYEPSMKEQIEALGEVTMTGWAVGDPIMKEEDLIKLVGDVEILITSYDAITRAVIEAAPKLKLIACTRANPVNVDTAAAKERGIPVLFTPGRNSDSVAEMVFWYIISCARHACYAYKCMHDGQFLAPSDKVTANRQIGGNAADVMWGIDAGSPYTVFKGIDIKGKTLGIIGFGSIGRRVAKIAHAFGMNVLLYDPFVSEVDVDEIGQTKVDLPTLLKNSDFVSVHLKVTAETKGLMGKEQFAMMKPTAYFINTARAAVMDEAALVEAIRNGEIAGAGLDVYAVEPLREDHPFVTEMADRVVITPHICGATTDAIRHHTEMIISDIKRLYNNEPLLYVYRG